MFPADLRKALIMHSMEKKCSVSQNVSILTSRLSVHVEDMESSAV